MVVGEVPLSFGTFTLGGLPSAQLGSGARVPTPLCTSVRAFLDGGPAPPAQQLRAALKQEVSKAQFDPTSKPLKHYETFALKLEGQPHPSLPATKLTSAHKLNRLEGHVAKHIASQDLRVGLKPRDYLDLLQNAARHPAAEVVVGYNKNQAKCAILLKVEALGASGSYLHPSVQSGHWLFVVYNLDTGHLESGYCVNSFEKDRVFDQWSSGYLRSSSDAVPNFR
jgi:hypothetical protein